MDILNNKPSYDLFRERKLKAQDRPLESVAQLPEAITADVLSELTNTQEKATILLSAIRNKLATLTIPVKETALDVKAAVLRKDPLSEGKYITFDLYLKSLAAEFDALDLKPGELAGLFTGHNLSDAKTLQNLSLAKVSGLSADEARLAQSQAMYLYILQMMIMGFTAIETEKQTSTKTTVLVFGTEVPVATASTIFSIAFQLAYSANLERDILDVMKESSANATKPTQVNLEEALKAAKSMDFGNLKLLNIALRAKDPEDYQLIKDYSRAFLRTTKKLGYEPWMLADEVYSMQRELSRITDQFKRYDANNPLNKELGKVLKHKASKYSRALDSVVSSLKNRYSNPSVICSLGWLMDTDGEPRAIILALLNYLLNNLQNDLGSFYIPEPTLTDTIADQVVHELVDIIGKIKTKLLNWFKSDNDAWSAITQCTPIADFVNAATFAIESIERNIFYLLETTLNRTRNLVGLITAKSVSVAEIARVKQLMSEISYTEAKQVVINGNPITEISGFNADTEVFNTDTSFDLGINESRFESFPVASNFLVDIQKGIPDHIDAKIKIPWSGK